MIPIGTVLLRIYNTPTKLNPPLRPKLSAVIVVTHGGMRFTWDGSDPHREDAEMVKRGDTIHLYNSFEIQLFNCMWDERFCNCWISVTYFEGELPKI
jgi:hypothetical protein